MGFDGNKIPCFDVGSAFILHLSAGAKPTAHERYIDICHPQARIFQRHAVYVAIGVTAIFIHEQPVAFVQFRGGTDVDPDFTVTFLVPRFRSTLFIQFSTRRSFEYCRGGTIRENKTDSAVLPLFYCHDRPTRGSMLTFLLL